MKMRRVMSSESGPVLVRADRPVAGPGQVLVQVAAAGLNRADLAAAFALPPRPLGMECSGEVVETGPGVEDIAVGDFVMCSGSGGYADYALADIGRCTPLAGSRLSMQAAGTLPLALMTAHDALITKGGLRAGQTVLIHGAGSAVGQMALKIAAWRGARAIIATARDPGRRAALAAAGATLTADPSDPDLVSATLAATDGKGADVVIDFLAGDYLNTTMQATAIGGRIINVGRLAGNVTSDFDGDLHAARQLSYLGVTFRSRTPEQIARINADMSLDLRIPLAEGRLTLPICATFALEDVAEAHALMRSNAHFGKIVLRP